MVKRLLVVALLALLLLGAAWVLREQNPEARESAGVERSAPAARAVPAPSLAAPVVLAPLKKPSSPSPVHSTAAADPGPSPSTTEVCGVADQVPLLVSRPDANLIDRLPPHLGAQAFESARQHWLHTLDSGDVRTRAAAALLRDDGAAALSLLAQGSGDAAVLAWALQRCPASGCDAALAARWVEIEPDNLAAWLSLADVQPERRAPMLERAAQARRFELHRPALMSTLLRTLPPSLPAHVRHALMQDLLHAEAALAAPALHTLETDCARAAPGTPGPSPQLCTAIAALLRDSDTLHARWAGLRMARAQGLPVPAFKAGQAGLTALAQAPDTLTQGPAPLGCAPLSRFDAWLQQRAALGEAHAAAGLDQRRPAAALTAGTRP